MLNPVDFPSLQSSSATTTSSLKKEAPSTSTPSDVSSYSHIPLPVDLLVSIVPDNLSLQLTSNSKCTSEKPQVISFSIVETYENAGCLMNNLEPITHSEYVGCQMSTKGPITQQPHVRTYFVRNLRLILLIVWLNHLVMLLMWVCPSGRTI